MVMFAVNERPAPSVAVTWSLRDNADVAVFTLVDTVPLHWAVTVQVCAGVDEVPT